MESRIPEVEGGWREELQQELSTADYHRLAKVIQSQDGLKPLKIGVLSTYSIQFIEPFLIVEGARQNLAVQTFYGEFGQLEQQLLDPQSSLYGFEPDVLVVALRMEDLDAEAIVRYHATDGKRFKALSETVVERLRQCIEAFSRHGSAPMLVANFAPPSHRPLGLFDAHVQNSLTYAYYRANEALQEIVSQFSSAFIWDYAGLVTAHGSADWCDPRLWAMARIAVSGRHQPHMAGNLIRTVCGVLWPPAKCLALDLDNTLWGGVIGDDGIAGIKLSDDYPGNAFKSFQRAILALMDRGILLTVVSKNDEQVAREAFEKHPEMLIKWEDLSAVRINWEPKSGNIRELAKELNIGADAIVLVDDNPVERAEVRTNAPEVLVLDLPKDPLGYVTALAECPFFDQTTVSEEDRSRGQMYRQQRARDAFKEQFGSIEDFLHSLEMTATLGEVDSSTMGRISQLVSKTNQFNLTTRRHSQSEIAAMAEDPGKTIAWLRLHDRFGDQGLVCVGILAKDGMTCVVDTFLMSCRVMNRKVENAFAAYLVEHALRLGCEEIIGEYIPTPKNKMVSELYTKLGFDTLSQEGEVHRFKLDLGGKDIEWPDVVQRSTPKGETA